MGRRAVVDLLVTSKVRYGYDFSAFSRSFFKHHLPVTKMPQIVRAYHRSCHMHTGIVETLRPHSVSFETSRQEINRWVAQPYLEETSWDVEWEGLCQVEVDRWQE